MKDWHRSELIIFHRKWCQPGRFNSYRLRALQCFALHCGAVAGLSVDEQEQLYTSLDIWDGTKPGMPQDSGQNQTLRNASPSVTLFKDAMQDDVDEAVVDAGWRKCALDQNGETYQACFRPVLNAILDQVRSGKDVQFWSGDGHPAPLTAMCETPLDGDAFRKIESEVVQRDDPQDFTPGLHLYSDASHISWSGGTWKTSGDVFFVIRLRGVHVFSWRPGTLICPVLTQ